MNIAQLILLIFAIIACVLGYMSSSKGNRKYMKENDTNSILKAINCSIWAFIYAFLLLANILIIML